MTRSASWLPILRIGLAGAACWHLLGNAGVVPNGALPVVVAAAAGAVVVRPRSTWIFAALTASVWVSIWQEAPTLGNHWLLEGFLTAAVVLGSVGGAEGGVAAARAVVLVFYGFAAFAKLNAGFFDPATSCATFYLSESARSLGLELAPPTGAGGTAVAVAVAATELSIPVLLVWRRTRTRAVALAVVFHTLLALDRNHQFYDFTSTLIAVFVTFLPVEVAGRWRDAVASRVRLAALQVGLGVLAVVAGIVVAGGGADNRAFNLGWFAWVAASVVVVPAVVVASWRHRHDPVEARPRLRSVPALAVPLVVLAILNGLTPYLELKTSTSWNMYANLRTVDGDSNHFLVRATLPIGDAQADLVRVVEADGALAGYVESRQLLPRRQLRWYLQHHPDVTGVIEVGGARVTLVPGEIPAELGPHIADVVGRLAALRASEPPGAPTPCQPAFLPAT